MSKINKMQGVPAQLVTLKATDKRRHPAHCKFHEGEGKNRICKCKKSPYYLKVCHSAKICNLYKEDIEAVSNN